MFKNKTIQLKQLKKIELENLKKEDLDLLIDNMLKNIGSVDPVLRDGLIYPAFIRIIGEDALTAGQY
jgi:hypothetical protein